MTKSFEWDTADGSGTYYPVGPSTLPTGRTTYGLCYSPDGGTSWFGYIWTGAHIDANITLPTASEVRSAIEALVSIYSNFTE